MLTKTLAERIGAAALTLGALTAGAGSCAVHSSSPTADAEHVQLIQSARAAIAHDWATSPAPVLASYFGALRSRADARAAQELQATTQAHAMAPALASSDAMPRAKQAAFNRESYDRGFREGFESVRHGDAVLRSNGIVGGWHLDVRAGLYEVVGGCDIDDTDTGLKAGICAAIKKRGLPQNSYWTATKALGIRGKRLGNGRHAFAGGTVVIGTTTARNEVELQANDRIIVRRGGGRSWRGTTASGILHATAGGNMDYFRIGEVVVAMHRSGQVFVYGSGDFPRRQPRLSSAESWYCTR